MTKKLLVVDDDRTVLTYIDLIFSEKGYEVVTAEDGLAALDVLETYTPDVILVDMVMPNIDGKKLCKLLRGMKKLKDTYLIVLSATAVEEEIKASDIGADAFIAKGNYEETSRHILAAIGQPEAFSSRCKSGEVIGIENVYPRRVTKELLSVKKHFEVIIDKISEGILEFGPKGRVLYANPAALSIIALPEEQLLGRNFAELFPAPRRQKILTLFESLDKGTGTIGQESPMTLNARLLTMDIVPVEKDGSRAVAILRDITERKLQEETLQASETRLRRLIEKNADSLMIVSPDNIVRFANPSAKTLFGESLTELTGGKFQFPLPTGESTEIELIDTMGNTVVAEMRAVAMEWEGEKAHLASLRDITARKRAERALRESEDKYRTILENMEEGYYEVDLAGNFTFLNDAMCKIRGYSREELMGMSNREYMTKKTAKEVFKAFSNVYTTGEPAKNLKWETIRKDGTKGYVETSASLIRDSEGDPTGFRGIVRDISEKYKFEVQLQQAQRMESIGTLAGGIAHNFNNLLMGIQGNASIMLLDIDSNNPRHKNLMNIEKLVENGAKLTGQLIGYAREGKYEVNLVNLNQLVKWTSETFGMTKKEITVHQELSEKLYGIKADQGQIEQVLLNLYVNAADAMPGGGDLFVKTINVADKDITGKPYEVKPGNYVLLIVRDTGVGMDKETKERIFEPFFTTKGLASGTGLGLASAYGIIKGHGGYIDVDSKIGEGTTFSICLPATETMIKEKKVLPDELVEGKGVVLLVDDEEMVLETGEVLLNHLGYDVLLAENGQEALELYKHNQDRIDVVLLDMVMPVMGGGETFDRMKEVNTNVKVLLSSGYSLEGEAEDILKRGCDAFIQKPFKMEQLSQKLSEVLGRD